MSRKSRHVIDTYKLSKQRPFKYLKGLCLFCGLDELQKYIAIFKIALIRSFVQQFKLILRTVGSKNHIEFYMQTWVHGESHQG